MPEATDLIDIAALTAPIPGDAPVGVDLRQDPLGNALYTQLRDARAEARTAERAQENEEGNYTIPPQWRIIHDLAYEALTGQTKDLEIAAWLTEALLRSNGLKGLSAGLQVMTGLVEQYWDDVFPLPDEDGVATRVGPVTGLNGLSGDGTLIPPLRRTPLFNRPDGEPLQLWQYEQSVGLAGIVDEKRRQQRIAAGVIPFATLEAEAQVSVGTVLATLQRDTGAAIEAWGALSIVLDARAGADSPPTTRVRDMLEQIRAAAAKFGGPIVEDAAAPAAEESGSAPAGAPAGESSDPAPGPIVAGAITSRADALRALVAVAAFFRRTEPLSPLAYTLEEVVRRAGMTWPQLLEEVLPDAAARALVLTTLGIRPPSAG
jgi:type VI secretion system protein ImpA